MTAYTRYAIVLKQYDFNTIIPSYRLRKKAVIAAKTITGLNFSVNIKSKRCLSDPLTEQMKLDNWVYFKAFGEHCHVRVERITIGEK